VPPIDNHLVRAEAFDVLGEYYHWFEIPRGEEFAIVYGPNGVGKTKFLEIIHAMIGLDSRKLTGLPFREAILRFADGTILQAQADAAETVEAAHERRRSKKAFKFILGRPGRDPHEWSPGDDDAEGWLLENTSWRPSGGSYWEDYRDGETVTIQELERRFPEIRDLDRSIPGAFRGLRRVVKSYLIETQRLRVESALDRPGRFSFRPPGQTESSSSRVNDQAKTMRSLVNKSQTEHSTITQKLDRTFPNRVLETESPKVDAERIRARYEDQNAFRSRLARVASVDLAEAFDLPDRDLEGWEQKLLTLYLDDAEAKLAPFVELLKKIELLEDILNSRLLGKRLRVTAKDGLSVRRERDGQLIPLDSLSSGEQHEIILLFDLLFNVPAGALVLIDEPEISLHVVWQMGFIPDVERIAELAGFKFVVATHSPQIINDRWERAYPLGPKEIPFV